MLEIYLDMPHDAPGRAVAESYEGDDSGFTRALADRYFSVVTAAVRAEDPNHLILGARVVSVMTPLEVVEAAGPHVDVLSVNNYEFLPAFDTEVNRTSGPFLARDGWLELFSEASGRPVMITEFSYRARDAGCQTRGRPSTRPPRTRRSAPTSSSSTSSAATRPRTSSATTGSSTTTSPKAAASTARTATSASWTTTTPRGPC